MGRITNFIDVSTLQNQHARLASPRVETIRFVEKVIQRTWKVTE